MWHDQSDMYSHMLHVGKTDVAAQSNLKSIAVEGVRLQGWSWNVQEDVER